MLSFFFLDDLSRRDTPYVSAFANVSSTNPCGLDQGLLELAAWGTHIVSKAYEHLELLQFVLSVYNKSFENFIALAGGNDNGSHAFAKKIGAVFVVCQEIVTTLL